MTEAKEQQPEKKEEAEAEEAVRLRKVMSFWDVSAFFICTVIGSGIFISPKGVLSFTGSPGMALVIWFVTGMYNLVLCLCYAEITLTFPSAGGDYNFLRRGYGDAVAFVYSWTGLLFREAAGRGVVALTFSGYFCQIFFTGCAPPEELRKLVAILALTLLTAIQVYSSRWAVATADFFTVAKLTGLVVIICSGLGYLAAGNDANLEDLMSGSVAGIGPYVLAFYQAQWAYGGIQNCVTVVEEMKEPLKRIVVGSIIFSTLVITVVYMLANLAYIIVLSPAEMLASGAVALSVGERISPVLFYAVPVFVSCSTFGNMNNSIMNSSRVALAAARQRHMPRPISLISTNYLTPMVALVFNLIVSLLLVVSNGVYDLIIYSTYLSSISNGLTILSLIINRIRNPDLERPFRLPLFIPIVIFLLTLFQAIFPFIEKTRVTLISVGVVASGVPAYFFFVWWKNKPEILLKIEWWITIFCQKLLCTLPEEFECSEAKSPVSKQGVDNQTFQMQDEKSHKE